MEKDNILQSWKEISNYLDRDTRTCLRWESELGLPVYRIDKESLRSKVFAYKSEIDQWLKKRATLNGIKKLSFFEKKRAVIGLITFLALLSVTFAVLFFSNLTLKPSPPQLLTIAVFPFENSNSSEFDKYFIEDITDSIANNLALPDRLKVTRLPSLSNHTNPPVDLNLVSKELDTDFILRVFIEINDSRDRVKMRAQLINSENQNEIWNKEYDNKLEDILHIKEEVCKNIISALNISPNEKNFSSPNNGEPRNSNAYDNYLKGSYILNYLNGSILNNTEGNNNDAWKLYIEGRSYMNKFTKKDNDQAINFFEKAIKNDSRFAPAYIGLASCYCNHINFDWDYNIKWLKKAEELLEKAQSIYPDLAEYYTTSIEVNLLKEVGFGENTKEITRELIEEGTKKHPFNPQLISIIGSYYFTKFGEEGNEADFEKALEGKRTIYVNDPLRIANFNYAELLMLKKNYSAAIYVCEFIDRYNPSYWVKSRLGEILYYAGELERSSAIFKEQENIDLDFRIDSMLFLSMIAAQLGEKEKALKSIEQINLLSPQENFLGIEFRLASIYFGLDMKELGYKNLRVFFESPTVKKMHYTFLKYIDIDKNFDFVRDEEEFKTIINTKG